MFKATAWAPVLMIGSILLAAAGCATLFGPGAAIRGMVRYIDLEGGFYGLIADDGARYDPLNLPADFRRDGLRVEFEGKVRDDLVGIHMWGRIFEIERIERL